MWTSKRIHKNDRSYNKCHTIICGIVIFIIICFLISGLFFIKHKNDHDDDDDNNNENHTNDIISIFNDDDDNNNKPLHKSKNKWNNKNKHHHKNSEKSKEWGFYDDDDDNDHKHDKEIKHSEHEETTDKDDKIEKKTSTTDENFSFFDSFFSTIFDFNDDDDNKHQNDNKFKKKKSSNKKHTQTFQLVAQQCDECQNCPKNADKKLYEKLKKIKHHLIKKSSDCGVITWDTFNSDQKYYQNYLVNVNQEDTNHGTLRIKYPVHIMLQSDIEFNPNPENDFKPYSSQTQYNDPAYNLGFFAVFTFESDNIVFDLNGYTIKQSLGHWVAQRFFSLLEISDRPFISGQGPMNFGSSNVKNKNTFIFGGKLGRSSHNGIHGNLGTNMLIENLHIFDFEVVGIQLNGFKNLLIQDTHVHDSLTVVPLNPIWSNFRFTKDFVELALNLSDGNNPSEESDLQNVYDQLLEYEQQVFDDIVNQELCCIDKYSHYDAYKLFNNPGKLPNGNMYGININPLGVSVNGFFSDVNSKKAFDSCNVHIKKTSITNLVTNVLESVAIMNKTTGKIQLGPVGDILDFTLIINPDGSYKSNLYNDLIFYLQILVNLLPEEQQLPFVKLNIDDLLVQWFLGNVEDLSYYIEKNKYQWIRNTDDMNHVQKGIVALRIDGGLDFCMKDIIIDNIVNIGLPMNTTLLPGEFYSCNRNDDDDDHHQNNDDDDDFCGNEWDNNSPSIITFNNENHFSNNNNNNEEEEHHHDDDDDEHNKKCSEICFYNGTDGGHPLQGKQKGYMGADTRGVSVSGSRNNYWEDIFISNIHSDDGLSYGFHVFNYAYNINIKSMKIDQVESQGEYYINLENTDSKWWRRRRRRNKHNHNTFPFQCWKLAKAAGYVESIDVCDVCLNNNDIKITNIQSPLIDSSFSKIYTFDNY